MSGPIKLTPEQIQKIQKEVYTARQRAIQQEAHDRDRDCYHEDCQTCCSHEFDPDEGYMCLNCGLQKDIGEMIDAAMDRYDE